MEKEEAPLILEGGTLAFLPLDQHGRRFTLILKSVKIVEFNGAFNTGVISLFHRRIDLNWVQRVGFFNCLDNHVQRVIPKNDGIMER